jgi:hypothetical protein
MSEELGELAPPTGTEEEVRSMVGALKAGISRGEASPKIAIVHEQQLFGPWNKLAKEFGLTTCARIT